LVVGPVVALLVSQSRRPEAATYSAFLDQLYAGNISSVTASDRTLTVTLERPATVATVKGAERQLDRFTTTLPTFAQPEIGAVRGRVCGWSGGAPVRAVRVSVRALGRAGPGGGRATAVAGGRVAQIQGRPRSVRHAQ